jgi:hypothetical protein
MHPQLKALNVLPAPHEAQEISHPKAAQTKILSIGTNFVRTLFATYFGSLQTVWVWAYGMIIRMRFLPYDYLFRIRFIRSPYGGADGGLDQLLLGRTPRMATPQPPLDTKCHSELDMLCKQLASSHKYLE